MSTKYYLLYIIIFLCLSCSKEKVLFEEVDPSYSNIHFSNRITESDSFNILEFEYIYNGAGIGLGDFNNDGLDDIFAAGNMVDNALYLNKGNFSFLDISKEAKITSPGQWSSGVAVVDINADGWQDIYVTNTTSNDSTLRTNNLYINQGLNADGIPIFEEKAKEYGLDDNSYSVNSAFFDYDNDGDLDVFIIINEMGDTRFHSQFRNQNQRNYYQRIDRLYRHDILPDGSHHFENISDEAGITFPGFSLGVNISDINKDGWKDIYISNDFLSDDVIYMNQQDGTFKNMAKVLLKHSSHSAMGNDVVDLNNDGYEEIVALDMFPETNYRQKRLLGETNYNSYLNNERFGYSYQYVRNTLQLNNGINQNQQPEFSEISLLAGISSTDWSWAPLAADFDHDGYRDLVITNGFPKDVTDHDFIDYKADSYRFSTNEIMLSKIPSIKEYNYAYKGSGLTFEEVTEEWGFSKPGYSNGAAYGDLDNDGDLDIVINNLNDSLSLMRNSLSSLAESGNYLQIKLKGTELNPDALGAQIIVKYDDEVLFYEHSIFRGYLSSNSKTAHFGLGNKDQVEIKVIWPDQSYHEYQNVRTNQTLAYSYGDEGRNDKFIASEEEEALLTYDSSFDINHLEEDFIDYNIQPLLPHKLSQYGPALTVGDIDNDGLDDIYVSGSAFYNGFFLKQQKGGDFLIDTFKVADPNSEESGALIFDINGDGLNDMVISSGSYEHQENNPLLKDKVYLNNGLDGFTLIPNALPEYLSNALNIKGADFDQDGDIDLFIGGRVQSGNYPVSPASYLLENQSTADKILFIISDKLPMDSIGMVTDAIWTDYNSDGWVDLIITRELDDILFLKNDGSKLTIDTPENLKSKKGFWNSISSGDLDNDGDIDYVLGNIGLNTHFPISEEYPYRIYVNDFDKNGSTDALPFVFGKEEDGSRTEYPFCSRMDFAKEINAIRKMLPSYHLYAQADINTLITPETMKETDVYEANYPYSAILWNDGNSQFSLQQLPVEAQFAPVFGTTIEDVDNDGHKEIILIGNDYGNELIFGRMDALNGLVLKGDGNHNFKPLSYSESGFKVADDGKSLAKAVVNNQLSLISGSNKGKIRKHDVNKTSAQFIMAPQNIFKIIFESKSKKWVSEMPIGNGFLSQSGRHIKITEEIERITGVDYKGGETVIYEKASGQ